MVGKMEIHPPSDKIPRIACAADSRVKERLLKSTPRYPLTCKSTKPGIVLPSQGESILFLTLFDCQHMGKNLKSDGTKEADSSSSHSIQSWCSVSIVAGHLQVTLPLSVSRIATDFL